MTFEDLCKEEPRLKELYEQVRISRGNRRKTANWIFYHEVKPKMKRLVGWLAENENLRTCQAWDIAYTSLYALLHSRKGRGVKGN